MPPSITLLLLLLYFASKLNISSSPLSIVPTGRLAYAGPTSGGGEVSAPLIVSGTIVLSLSRGTDLGTLKPLASLVTVLLGVGIDIEIVGVLTYAF